MAELIFHKTYIETDMRYVCSRAQAAAIITKRRHIYKQDTRLAADSNHPDLTSWSDGLLRIGCLTFTKSQVTRLRRTAKPRRASKGSR